MYLKNPLQLNDWEITSFIRIVLIIQVIFCASIGLDLIKIQIPILRQLVSFLILTFIPGILILRILRIHDIGNVKTVVYSLGSSVGILMIIGLFINTIFPILGFNKPISFWSLFITINIFILSFCILAYLRDKDYSKPTLFDIKEMFSPYFLILCLIPFISIFGTYLLNQYNNNILQMTFLVIIAIIPLITLKWIPKKWYPLVMFISSISILFHTTLISQYIWGADINSELLLANTVLKNALWIPSISIDTNAMLSIVLLAPIYSIISNLNLVWCFKIIYPALFSFVPVILFVAYKELTKNDKMALLACILFISVNAFFTTLPSAARQEIAEIFLALIILIIVDKKLKGYSKSFLLLLFGFSLVVSHYGVAYILLLIIGVSILVILLLNILPSLVRVKRLRFENYKVINNVFPLFILCFALAWFMYVSNANIFIHGELFGQSIINSITDVLNPSTSQAYNLIRSTLPIFQSIERYLYIITEVLIGIGVLNVIFNNSKTNTEFKIFSLASFLILVIGIIFPYFASAMNTDRLLQINLLFLAIYLVTGSLTVIKVFNSTLSKLTKKSSIKITLKKTFYLIGIFLLIFSIFNTAFIYQIFDQSKMGKFALDNNQDFYTVNHQEISAVNWLHNNRDPQTSIYADTYKYGIIRSLFNSKDNCIKLNESNYYEQMIKPLTNNTLSNLKTFKGSYLFFGTFNIKNQEYITYQKTATYIRTHGVENDINKIYDNGNSWILKGLV